MSVHNLSPYDWTVQRRSAVALVRTALSSFDDAAQAWETLALYDALPQSWLDSPVRQFCVLADWGALAKDPPALGRHPRSVEACLALADRLEDLLNAEALGWALACCLRDWGGAWPARVRWVLSPAPLPHATNQTALPRVCAALYDALASWCDRAYRARAMRDRSAARRASAAAMHRARADAVRQLWQREPAAGVSPVDPLVAQCASYWARCIRLGVAFNRYTVARRRLPREWEGRSVTQLLDPLEPLAELAAFGVSLGPITDEALYLSVAIPDRPLPTPPAAS